MERRFRMEEPLYSSKEAMTLKSTPISQGDEPTDGDRANKKDHRTLRSTLVHLAYTPVRKAGAGG